MKKASLLAAALVSAALTNAAPASVALAAEAEAKTFLSIATGGTAGVYYPLGVGLAQVITSHLSADVEATAQTSDGSAANVNLAAKHKTTLALAQSDVVFRAVNGEKPFQKPVENLRMIASLYPEYVQCIAAGDSGVRAFSDIEDKRVSVGTPGSGTMDSVAAIFSVAGVKYSDLDADFLNFADTAERLQDGRLDVGFVIAGSPTAAVAALAAQKKIDLVAFEDDLLDNLVETYPFFIKGVIPAGIYSGVDHDTPTPALIAVLVCNAALPEKLVYDITKTIFENLEELAPAHDQAKSISLDSALGGAIAEIHPGAAKYYAEKGLQVPSF
ncbi:MAG: TAXI family TRAP transporter solute-binding subunit [Synergistaceae bacterium]|nr:TAXI family TRAP transporter solute-binding subunit [Synergistaceae bacterium]